MTHPTGGPADVICAGVLVADIFVPPLSSLPAAGQLQATGDFWIDSGGCAANAAACLRKLDVSVEVAGAVGDDIFGEFVQRDLEAKGIGTGGLRRSAASGTSKTVILPVVGEDRRYIHTFGANADFRVEHLVRKAVAAARVLYVGGYLVLPGFDPAALRDLFAFAREQGVHTVLDVAVTEGGGAWEDLAPVLSEVDFLMPNDDEARALTGRAEPREQAARLLEAGCGTAIITLGEGGALLMDGEQTLHIPGFPIDLVDGSGAGDAFDAGWIAGLLRDLSPAQCLRLASAVGASACTQLGCTTGVFTRAEADAFLDAH